LVKVRVTMNVEFLIKNSFPFNVEIQIDDKQLIPLKSEEQKYILLRYKDRVSIFKDGMLILEPIVIESFSKRNIYLSSLSFTDLGDQNYYNSYSVIPSISVFNYFNFPINVYLNYKKIAVLYPYDTNFKFNYYSTKSRSSIYLDNDQNGFKTTDNVGFSTVDKKAPQVYGKLEDKYLRQVHIGRILIE
jgi:hypothetical protein